MTTLDTELLTIKAALVARLNTTTAVYNNLTLEGVAFISKAISDLMPFNGVVGSDKAKKARASFPWIRYITYMRINLAFDSAPFVCRVSDGLLSRPTEEVLHTSIFLLSRVYPNFYPEYKKYEVTNQMAKYLLNTDGLPEGYLIKASGVLEKKVFTDET